MDPNSVEKLKLALLNSETMVYCTPDTETKVMVHASPTELRAGKFRPKVYASVTLNPTEQGYSQTERESLAVSWAFIIN